MPPYMHNLSRARSHVPGPPYEACLSERSREHFLASFRPADESLLRKTGKRLKGVFQANLLAMYF